MRTAPKLVSTGSLKRRTIWRGSSWRSAPCSGTDLIRTACALAVGAAAPAHDRLPTTATTRYAHEARESRLEFVVRRRACTKSRTVRGILAQALGNHGVCCRPDSAACG